MITSPENTGRGVLCARQNGPQHMPKAVQLYAYGGIDQLRIVDVPKPMPEPGEVVVRIVAAGTNPGEIAIREGLLREMYPMTFPFGQGTDFAGQVDSVGADVTGLAPGDEVLGWSERRSGQAEYVASTPSQLILKPSALDWFRAGSLFVVATTAVAVQLSRRAGARVIGIASDESAEFLRSVGVESLAYGDGLAERLRTRVPSGIDAFIDLFGGGYVELAATLGVARQRINTIIDFAGAQKYGVKTDGSSAAASRETLATVANLIAWGEIVMPLTAIYPLASVRDAYTELARRKTRGKIVLAVNAAITEPMRPPKAML
jgi:NADPH2:quinone reductase